ncbi:MAG: DNA primase [Rothia sp. (in: high G+C Gram-positive bacteria)]|uniref:DNA primase n=1 Tax=Rothia sp. (in: high G+C Gram-positive bacteria) TaxID=1885016 RepID=UPI0026DEB452|nr:DNA primase [Rothia sp. (in: high G+C Gram-positive bacteria)]MDO5750365.1 DNA primase [Rothia sp. (in: high G+C Gram-positive bacteria)]
MAGLIRKEDIDEVRSRTDIREIIEGYVTLKTAGIGTFKGLCPFHDERTPSFNVRPAMGTYHCFGCGESGDVYSFMMAMEHTSFVETVERLAARLNYELHYEGGGGADRYEAHQRRRLLDAHKVAAEFYEKQLYSAEAGEAQRFLGAKGFTPEDAKKFGVGYAPRGWDNLYKHLRAAGFKDEELRATGMFSDNRSGGMYDRFRGRVMWPIRTVAGETIGFGARRIYEDDQGPKYLNTPETSLYKKSQVLYGIDLAKRSMTKSKRVVIVEGYTDVMAAHLAGVDTAVATCGTAFGAGHIRVVRRMITDDGSGGEIVFTFDGDAAGQKAAMAAFEQDQSFVAQTYVTIVEDGMDPCDLRLAKGDAAVRALIEAKRPLFEFVVETTLKAYDLSTIEGRVLAMRAVAPVVAGIKDRDLRSAYMRRVSGMLGMGLDEVQRAVAEAQRNPKPARSVPSAPAEPSVDYAALAGYAVQGVNPEAAVVQQAQPVQQNYQAQGYQVQPAQGAAASATVQPGVSQPGVPQTAMAPQAAAQPGSQQLPPGFVSPVVQVPVVQDPTVDFVMPSIQDPVARVERAALESVLQLPQLVSYEQWQNFARSKFRYRVHREIAAGVVHAASHLAPAAGIQWLNAVREGADPAVHAAIAQFSVERLPVANDQQQPFYVHGVMCSLQEAQIARRKSDLMMHLQRLNPETEALEYQAVQRELLDLERERRALRSSSSA